MPFRYLESLATADVAFEAWGDSLEELFAAAADAAMNVMVADLDTLLEKERRTIEIEETELDMLLFQLLQELIFQKDAYRLLLRVGNIRMHREDRRHRLAAEAYGEEIDPQRHDLVVDVKAVTLHRFRVERIQNVWKATVVLDV